MDIVVKGRNVEVPGHYRTHVADKLRKIERYDHKLIRIDVELSHEPNPRQSGSCQCVEITCASRGPLVRAEARAGDFYSALDLAIARIDARLRRSADRRRVHKGRHPASLGESRLTLVEEPKLVEGELGGAFHEPAAKVEAAYLEPEDLDDQPWHIVRLKEHSAKPITVDDALFQMELVGHDFFLFMDKESNKPSVVYRRRGYDYGVIALGEAA